MAKLLIKILIVAMILFFCACLPQKRKGIILEGKTTAPHGYTEMIERSKNED